MEALIRRRPSSISGEHPGLLNGIPPALDLPPAEQASAQFNGVVEQAWSGVAATGVNGDGAGVE